VAAEEADEMQGEVADEEGVMEDVVEEVGEMVAVEGVAVTEVVEVAVDVEEDEEGQMHFFFDYYLLISFDPHFLRRGGGMKGGAKVIIEAHRHEGVFIARSKEDALVTLNSTPGKDVYGEKRIQVIVIFPFSLLFKLIRSMAPLDLTAQQ
jgi:hypothetical protein